MKKPYKLTILFFSVMSIFCGILTILDFPNWISGTAICIGGIIYTIYLGRKDEKEDTPSFEEKLTSECPKDYKKHHYWERRGVVLLPNGRLGVVWQCTQCSFSIVETLEPLEIK